MPEPESWTRDLIVIDELMRDLSVQSDPQAAALMYGKRLRAAGLVPSDDWVSVSRRNLNKPEYRITRSSRWKNVINPWKQTAELPRYSTGLLGELIYENKPTIVRNLQSRLAAGDPMAEQLAGFDLLVALPMYDEGQALNMQVLLSRDASTFPFERIPALVWQANLWGRSVTNLVLRQELQESFAKLTSAHTALEREMTTVGQVQRSLLPASTEALKGLDVAVHYETSQRAGGDYYDFFRQSDGSYGVLIADVSGHGAAAAVLMAVTHALAQLHPGLGCPPSDMLGFLNDHLSRKYTLDTGSFITAFYGILDPVRHRFVYASAGHPQPRIVRNGQVIPVAAQGGFPLGIEECERYAEAKIDLMSGDRLVLFTDGITEARNSAGELFGTERLDAVLQGVPQNADAIVQQILAAVDAFAGDRKPDDDRTIVVLGMS